MKWHWKVRIYHTSGHYGIGQFATERDLRAIDTIQDFYQTLTGMHMVLEGMSEHPYEGVKELQHVFDLIWRNK